MSTWMEILNIKHTEANKTKNTRHPANSGRHTSRRQKHSRGNVSEITRATASPSLTVAVTPAAVASSTTSSGQKTGILQALSTKLKGENTVQYVALNQTELEKGLQNLDYNSTDNSDRESANSDSNSCSSSLEEDLFVTNSRRRVGRKMTRKGTYSMRETFEDSRQYYPATHQHYNNLQQQQHQQQQQQHEQTIVPTQAHCYLHKGVVGKQHQYQHPQQLHQNQHQHVQQQKQHFQHQQPQIRHEYNAAQSQQQYQNVGTWLPQNKPSPKTQTTATNGELDDCRHVREPQQATHLNHEHFREQQSQQQQQQHHHNYCTKRLDAGGGVVVDCNSVFVEDDFVVAKTYITPPDIPSPPPQPVLSDNKRFPSAHYTATTATASASLNSSINIKTCCQCEGRVKNQPYLNNIQAQQEQLQPQKQSQYQRYNMTAGTGGAQNAINTPTTLTHQHQHHPSSYMKHQLQPQHFNQQLAEETLISPKASSALMSHHQQQQQQQHQHHQHQQPLHYRKLDVFAAAVDDDDNDTSPSIKLEFDNLSQYNCSNKAIIRNCKHLLNKPQQQQHQHNLTTLRSRIDLPYPKAKADDKLSSFARASELEVSDELENLPYWQTAHHRQPIKFNSPNHIRDYSHGVDVKVALQHELHWDKIDTTTSTNSTHQHILYNNESHLQNYNNFGTELAKEKANIEKPLLSTNRAYKQFILPIDIPTPPLPYTFNVAKRHIDSHSTLCQCENPTNFLVHANSNNNNNNSNSSKLNHHHQQHHISFIQTPTRTKRNEAASMSHDDYKSTSDNGHNYNVRDHHHQHQHQQNQHHHLCQQKTLNLHNFSNHQHSTRSQQQQPQPHSCNEQYRQHNYQPQLPQLLYQQHNSLTSHSIAPSFNGSADKNCMKNLVYSPQKLRRVRIIIGIVGGIVLLGLLGTALYFIISGSTDTTNNESAQPTEGIHLEDVLQGNLIARHFNGSWSTGSNVLYKEDNAIMEYNVVTKQRTRLMLDEFQQYVLYEKSADGLLLLLAKNYKKNFRHSYEAEYDIYNISSGQIQPLLIKKESNPLIMVHWSPVGNALIINFERNLYYKPSAFADEVALTDDTNAAILNGIPDWVYEEEVFSSNSASWFSPDGKLLAFIQFDDSPTRVINFPVYGEAGDTRFQYPFNRLVAYPKAGSSNPRVKLFTSDLVRAAAGNTDHLTEIPVPSALNTEGDYLITIVDWVNNTNVLSVWMNRIQNSAHMQIFNGLSRQEIYSLESKTGWVDFFSAPLKNRDGSRIALILPQAQGTDGDYRHLCLLTTTATRNTPEAITKGKYVVTSILYWDNSNDVIFYTANTEANPEVLHVYSIRAATGQTAKCLTCKLHTSNGVEQTYYSADFNAANQVIITSLGPSIPQTIIYEWSYANNQVSLTKLLTWEDNESLTTKLKEVGMPSVEIYTFTISTEFTAKVLLQLPPNMDRSGKTKYPLLVDVYGGPDSYSVVNKWIVDWGTYLSSNQSVIYAKIDGRGSGLRGEKLLHSIYLKLGTLEINDQIDVTRKLQEKFNFIDANHTGIWGWSYGGYAAAMALANDETNVFRCAASIAPVTDWAYYDSIYTERYMSTPDINVVGYSDARLSTRATKLKGKKFLLVHGTLDDNVHYQQAMILAKNLERHDILFKQISYPDEDHALAGVRPHLYHSLDRFFGECFAQTRMALSK